MKIGILGAGNVGGTLGVRWAAAGHAIQFGVRDSLASSVTQWVERAGDKSHAGTLAEAVAFADVVVFALPYSALESTVQAIGNFGDKVLIDCTNPISSNFAGLTCGGESASEEIAEWTGSQKVVKCFNTVGFNIMANPMFDGLPASMLYCGNDKEAKATAAQLATDIGFDPIDAGPLHQAKWLESFAWLWVSMAVKHGHGREMAFVLHKRG